ncbi:MAG: adenine nucleotide alpha hydrolase [Pseudomonadota bacterium]
MSDALNRLVHCLNQLDTIAIAVSGGVDSMTLAHVAHSRSSAKTTMFHAISPAVPDHATARVRHHAGVYGWDLHVVGAGEFDDPDYVRNPVNRCYFCKSNLYGRLSAETHATLCSGTNTDDLGDFRPGLRAADEQNVRHPFVEADIDKAGVRQIASTLGLGDLAELPAQPCLSSRVETGLPIVADQLALIDRLEQRLASALGPGDIRARMTHDGVRVEVPAHLIPETQSIQDDLVSEISAAGYRLAGIAPYKRGSAFLRDATT